MIWNVSKRCVIQIGYLAMLWFSRPILHKFANEDVSLGSWLIGLEVDHIDDRSLCCGTPPGMSPHHYYWLKELESMKEGNERKTFDALNKNYI